MPGMTVRTSPWPAGVPCWADLVVTDVERAKAFYAAVLGWQFEAADPAFGGYTIATAKGAAVAGVGPRQAAGIPSEWTLYFASDDVGATAEAVTAGGGGFLMEPHDVGELGRMCIAIDPAGAVFGVWQAGTHIGASLANEPGGLVWEDLRSTDVDAAKEFYAGLFGFRVDPLEMAGPDYATFTRPDEEFPLGGMGGMMGAAEGMSSHWLVYWGVEDAAAAADRARATGGSVVVEPHESPYGRMAGIDDPEGATFMVIEPTAEQPDRSS